MLDLSDGSFELADGRVSADTIEAGTLWAVTLTAGSTGTPLVTADTVDLSGATLDLGLDYTPALAASGNTSVISRPPSSRALIR